MARDKLTEYSATASENTVCGDVNIAENSALPSDLNNYAREIMTHLKNFSDGTDAIDALTVTGDLTVDTNTLHVDAANNRVGAGTVSPDTTMHIHTSSAGTVDAVSGGVLTLEKNNHAVLQFLTPNDKKGIIYFGDPDDIDAGRLEYDHSSNSMLFNVNASERMRILSGGGLTFNGDTATANALDDYEEGSYTPQISATDGIGTLTYSYQVGRYTKVGNRVMFNAYVQINNKGTAAGLFRITTPFTPANITNNHVAIAHWINGSEDNQAFEGERVTYAYLAANEPIVRFYSSNGDGGLNHLSAAHVKNGTDFMISGTFQV